MYNKSNYEVNINTFYILQFSLFAANYILHACYITPINAKNIKEIKISTKKMYLF